MKVVKVIRTSVSSARVQLDNGLIAKIPVELVSDEFTDTDFVPVQRQYSQDYLYRTLVKPKRVPRELKQVRDMSKFDATRELKLLESLVRKNQIVYAKTITDEEVEDTAMDIFLHFWERKLYQGYDETKVSSYYSFLSRAVRNYMIDQIRSSEFKGRRKQVSLDTPLKNMDEEVSLADVIPDDTQDSEKLCLDNDLITRLGYAVEALDEEGTGLKGITYSDIFKTVFGLTNKTFEDLVVDSDYSAATVKSRKKILIEWLRPVYEEWVA